MKQTLSILTLLILCLSGSMSYSQQSVASGPEHFRSADNPYYWRNRPPYPGYWQQDVYYKIDATIDETKDLVTGTEQLIYWNNSPDTLTYVYFHLYQQAFVKGGHLEALNLENKYKQTFGPYHEVGKGEEMESIKVNGIELKQEKDFSVVKVYLTKPLYPGTSITFDIKFTTYWDNGSSQRSRFKKIPSYGLWQYDGVHWYPRICVYDRKFGWDTDQHLGKEFYGNFGSFEVSLNFASNFVVEATGTLLNEKEVMPADLREKLDIKHFVNKPWGSAPSTIIPYNKDERKVWKYYAENVHDFAFTADPHYRIGETIARIPGGAKTVRCISLVQEPKASGWRNAADYAATTIETHSRNFGDYCWPKIIVADAADGMEYPMITLDGGSDPGYRGLFLHEIGHMWYMGMVGNNETYRAALDEGFTQFIQSYSQIQIDGEYGLKPRYKSAYVQRYKDSLRVRFGQVYLGYLFDAVKGQDESFNQHSDCFHGALGHGGGYRHVYYKTATMLWNLQYVLGDSLFLGAMKNYFHQWKFAHPYMEDMRNSFIQYTKVDLNWFFDEWIEDTKKIDYKVDGMKKKNGQYQIKLERIGRSQMPLDVAVVREGNDTLHLHIPNTWFKKDIDTTKTAYLPKWYGWDRLHPTYTITLNGDKKIKNVIIDPTYRLADVNLVNNSLKCPVRFRFDSRIYNTPDWTSYILKWRPDVWYNAVDGVKAGLHFNGNYMNYKNIFSLSVWANTRLGQQSIVDYEMENDALDPFPVSINFSYTTPIPNLIRNSTFNIKGKYLDGLIGGEFGVVTNASNSNTISFGFKTMYRRNFTDVMYALYPDEWAAKAWNNTMRFNFTHNYNYIRGNGTISFNAVSSAVYSTNNYAYANISGTNRNRLGKFDFNTRVFVQYGTGDIPGESALYLAGGNMEEMMENKYVRSRAFVPNDWLGYGAETNHFQYGGGLNLRGYAGYVVVEQQGNDLNNYYVYKGKSGAAINGELEFDRLLPLRPRITRNWLKLTPYLFGDAGVMAYDNAADKMKISSIRADAGAGITATIKRFLMLDEIAPLTVRFDVPFWVNKPPFVEGEYVKFRWLLSINQSF